MTLKVKALLLFVTFIYVCINSLVISIAHLLKKSARLFCQSQPSANDQTRSLVKKTQQTKYLPKPTALPTPQYATYYRCVHVVNFVT